MFTDPFTVFLIVFILLSTWTIYKTIQRLFLSPLAKIPGPRLAALTYWYEAYYDVVKPGQYAFKIKELHQQYGPIIRINPQVVHVSDLEFLDKIYAQRDRNQPGITALMVEQSVGGTADYNIHKMRREALSPYFSQKTVMSLEPLLRMKVQLLCDRFNESLAAAVPINLSDAYFALSNDIVRSYSFGNDNSLLCDLSLASLLRKNLARLLLGVQFSRHFGWLLALTKILPSSVEEHLVPPGIKDLLQFKSEIRKDIQTVLDDRESFHKGGFTKSVFYELRDSPILPPAEKSLTRLEHEATLLIMAGTESTAKTIGIAHYYLLAYPDVMRKLRAELESTPQPPSLSDLESLPYLTAVLAEANRLSFGVTGRLIRTAPHETLQYKQYVLPPGTRLCTTTLVAHTNKDIFPDPWTFNPERWLGAEGKNRQKFQLAFGKGHRKCLGINLANAVLCLAIATAAKYDMHLFETDEKDVRFQYDFQISHPRLDSKGVRATVKGKAASI